MFEQAMKTKLELLNLAKSLNTEMGKEIDWQDPKQTKYYIAETITEKHPEPFLVLERSHRTKIFGAVYCLDKRFLEIAVSVIGEKRLHEAVKNEVEMSDNSQIKELQAQLGEQDVKIKQLQDLFFESQEDLRIAKGKLAHTQKELTEAKAEISDYERIVAGNPLLQEPYHPSVGDEYWYVSEALVAHIATWTDSSTDSYRKRQGNVFKTIYAAEQYATNLYTKLLLKELAEGLNGDRTIDWNDDEQYKYSICISTEKLDIQNTNFKVFPFVQAFTLKTKQPSQIYCLDELFMEKAVKTIGRKPLFDMIESGV